MWKRVLLTVVCSFLANIIVAKSEHTVVATYRFHVPEHMSLEEAKKIALDRAKISVIEDKFGSIVSQANSTIINNENGHTDSKFISFGGSEIRGEWIETLSKPIYGIEIENGMTIITVNVKGKIREIEEIKTDFIVKVLRNGIDDRYESTEFKNGNDLFLSFKSPIAGFLSVYLVDTNTAYCLLPYKRKANGIFQVNANQDYLLFNKKMYGDSLPQEIDEYVMNCGDLPESNILYVLFSPNKFSKSVDDDIERYSPRVLPIEKFYNWLEKQKRRDREFNIKQIPIIIKP